ncbi:hypothetical protein [Aeromonas sobria]|uniref:hypothetical protein n=1 Tax=Aeromonas sobria TaxID=646 RepID=UPI00111A2886|nr:hypothetical protein [Aeromonas sobria]
MIANTEKKQEVILTKLKGMPWQVFQIGDLVFAYRDGSRKFLEGNGTERYELPFHEWKAYCFRVLKGTRSECLFSVLSLLHKTNRKYCTSLGVYPSLLDIPTEFRASTKQTQIKNPNCYSNFIQF